MEENNFIKVDLKYKETNIQLYYSNDGRLEYVKNLGNNQYLIIQTKYYGCGYEIKKENSIILNNDIETCNVKYAKILDLNIFVPRYIFIESK